MDADRQLGVDQDIFIAYSAGELVAGAACGAAAASCIQLGGIGHKLRVSRG